MEKRTTETIAAEMAKYFTSNVSLSELINWSGEITYKISRSEVINNVQKDDAVFFTSFLISDYITSMMKCKTDQELFETAKKQVIYLFNCNSCQEVKLILKTIGEVFLLEFSKNKVYNDITNSFLKVFQLLMNLCSMYEDYEFFEKEGVKGKNLKAA